MEDEAHAGALLDLVPLFEAKDAPQIATRMHYLFVSKQRMELHEELQRAMRQIEVIDALHVFLNVLEHQIAMSYGILDIMSLLPLVSKEIAQEITIPPTLQDAASGFFSQHLLLKAANTSHTGIFCVLYNVPPAVRLQKFEEWLKVDSVSALKFLESAAIAELVNLRTTLQYLVEKTHFNAADRLVLLSSELQREYVQLMIDNYVDAKVVRKRLTRFNFNADDFPEFVARRRRATIRYLVQAGQFGDIDQAVGGDANAMKFACHFLHDKCGADSVVTRQFVHLYNLGSVFPDVDLDSIASADDIGLLKDNPPRLEGFVSILNYLPSESIIFVDTIDAIQSCAQDLMAAPVVGLDCEWKASYDSFTSTGSNGNPCSLMQLSTSTRVYLIDMLIPNILSYLTSWLASPSSIKLGFDIKGDIAALQTPHIRSILDMQTFAKASKSRASLSDLAVKYFGLPLDKRVRMSNWERRPLTAMQREYAALDAFILVKIFEMMKEENANLKYTLYDVQGRGK